MLFAPGGLVQETGAANFMLIDAERVVTPALTTSFLHGVTRDSLLTLARDLGFAVEERDVTVDEVVAWSRRDGAEAGLSGTAAILAPIGRFVHRGETVVVGSGEVGPHAMRLRQALTDLQSAPGPTPTVGARSRSCRPFAAGTRCCPADPERCHQRCSVHFRVLDLSDERGQLCGQLLAFLGAEVILIEPPGGSIGPAGRSVRAGPGHRTTPGRS